MANKRMGATPSQWQLEAATALAAAIREQLLEEFPELRDDKELWRDTLDGETSVLDQVKEWLNSARWCRARAESAWRIADEAGDFAQRYDDKEARIRQAASRVMEELGIDYLPGDAWNAHLQSEPAKLVGEIDPYTLPDEFVEVKVTKRVKRRALLEALKAGRQIDGVSWSNGGRHLVIRPT